MCSRQFTSSLKSANVYTNHCLNPTKTDNWSNVNVLVQIIKVVLSISPPIVEEEDGFSSGIGFFPVALKMGQGLNSDEMPESKCKYMYWLTCACKHADCCLDKTDVTCWCESAAKINISWAVVAPERLAELRWASMLLYLSHLMGKLVVDASFIGENILKFKRLYKEIQKHVHYYGGQHNPPAKGGKI